MANCLLHCQTCGEDYPEAWDEHPCNKPKKVGRPSDYNQDIATRLCAQIVEGISLRRICMAKDMPSTVTVFRWLAAHEEFSNQYARAREAQADTLADELTDIADDGSNDWMERNDPKNPGWEANGEHLQRSRLRVDTRKWIASKLKPKKYGEKLTQEHTGAGGGPIIVSPVDAKL